MTTSRDGDAFTMKRRQFLKLAASAAAVGGVGGGTLAAQERRAPGAAAQQEQVPLVPLGNGEPPAMQFQAYPGGTGALMEKLWREHDGNPFERHAIPIAAWQGPVPATEEELVFLPVHRLAALLRTRRVSSVELTEIYLARLKRLDPVLLCAVTILDGRAQEEAQQADAEAAAGDWRGPLHGIPYGVKDLFSVRGARTTWGSSAFEERVIDDDAAVVVRLREAGAVLIAKLSTGEFAAGDRWYRGRTNNPWNLEQGSSGSSAGPASATAAGCVAFGIGTETQGSIVSPARRCGLSALRPTFGRVTRQGGMVLSWSMDKVGPLCRTIEDCALVFNTIHGADEQDPASLTAPFAFNPRPDLSQLRIGYTEDAPETFVATLRELGAAPQPMPELPDGRSNALNVESSAAFDFHIAPGGVLTPEPEPVEGERRRRGRFRGGRDVLALDYVQAQRRRWILMQEMAQAMEGFDMFVSGSGNVRLTNQTGHPAAIVPYDFSGDVPQPVCTTIVGDLFTDDKILSVAHAYQTATDWHTRHPALG
jgi:Asp-tRNA(Asn)/Glu-tRNA(Gln) amidotransferase A subunit family amidase